MHFCSPHCCVPCVPLQKLVLTIISFCETAGMLLEPDLCRGTQKWSSLPLLGSSAYRPFYSPVGLRQHNSCFPIFTWVWTDSNSFTFLCFSEIFLPSSNEESLVCRSSTDSLLETYAVHHLYLKSLLTTRMYLTAQLFLPWYPAICSMLTRMCSQYSRQAPCYSPFLLAPVRNLTPGDRKGSNLRWNRELSLYWAYHPNQS